MGIEINIANSTKYCKPPNFRGYNFFDFQTGEEH
jgi:hypothetical protein